MKKQLTDYRILIIAILIIVMAVATSCSTSRYGCPSNGGIPKQGARHDKNLRFGAYIPVIINETAPDCVASREAK